MDCETCKSDVDVRHAWTCSGDHVARLGAWCARCGRFIAFVEATRELRMNNPPWRFIPLQKPMPLKWDGVAKKWFKDQDVSFDFGENLKDGGAPHLNRNVPREYRA